MAGEEREQDAAEGTGGAADAGDAADGCAREHVRRGGVEVGGPALVGGGGEADDGDRDPLIGSVRGEEDGQDATGAEQHGEFAGAVSRDVAAHQPGRKPAATDAAGVLQRRRWR